MILARRLLRWWHYAVVVLATLIVHNVALFVFFTADDLVMLARVEGLAAWPTLPWRAISGRFYYEAFGPWFGARPFPWHAISLVLHVLNACAVAACASRLGVSPGSALMCGGLFGVSASALPTVWAISGIGELLACSCVLLGLLAALSGRMTVSALVFSFGLLSKETIVLTPIAAGVLSRGMPKRRRYICALVGAVLGLGLFVYSQYLRAPGGPLAGRAYEWNLGSHIVRNTGIYLTWMIDRLGMLVPTGTPLPHAVWAGPVAIVTMMIVGRQSVQMWFGFAMMALALAPVLALVRQVQVHYTYVPLTGVCIALGAVADRIAGVERERRRAMLAIVVVLVGVLGASHAIHRVTRETLPETGLPKDSLVRRMVVARNLAESVRTQVRENNVRLVILRPAQSGAIVGVLSGERFDGVDSINVLRALDLHVASVQGEMGLRALIPELVSVRFASNVTPEDSSATIAAAAVDGRVLVAGKGREGAVKVSEWWDQAGFSVDAVLLRESARSM